MISNRLTTETFFKHLSIKVLKNYSGRAKLKLEEEIRQNIGTREFVVAGAFYNTLVSLNEDIDETCNTLFKKLSIHKLDILPESDNKLMDFLTPFTKDSKEISSAMGIESPRLSKLKSGESKSLFPNEVYSLAKAFSLKPSELFDYFYGDGERPKVGV